MELRRAGNVAGMEAYAKELDAICERVMRERPALAEPYLLRGRMRRALDESRDALADQERALALDPLCHEARYERVVLRARLYQDHAADVVARAWRDEGERLARMGGLVTPPAAGAVLRSDPALKAARAAMEADLKALPKEALAAGTWACAQGLLAWCRDDRDAYALLEQAGTDDALEALAYAEYYSDRLDSAEAWATRGLEADAGNAPLRLLRGSVRKSIAETSERRGADGARRLAMAEEDFAVVCEQYPKRATGWQGRGNVAESRANGSAASNVVDTAAYEQAIAYYTRAIELDPGSATLLAARGHARMNYATVTSDRGPEGDRLYGLAIDDLLAARRLAPDSDEVLGTLGAARTLRALTLEAHGTPSAELFSAGLADLDEAVKLHAANNLHLRAMALGNRGKLEDEMHRDALEWYRRAAADWERALSLKPANAWLRLMAVVTKSAVLVARSKGGEDVRDEQEKVLAEFGALVEDNPKSDMALVWAGTMWMNAGLARIRGGAAPEEYFKRALAYFDRGLELNPRRVEAWRDRALLKSNWGGLLGQSGKDGRPLLEGAIADAGEAIKRDPARSDAWRVRGAARVNLAPHVADPAAEFARAEEDFGEALARDPRDVQAWSGRGSARLQLGWERAKAGNHADEIFGRALSDFNEALQRRPEDVEALGERGILRQTWGELVQRRRESGLELHRAALEDLDRAIKMSPRDGNLWYYRGNARLGLAIEVSRAGRNATPLLKEAVKDWTEAERLAPWLRPYTQQKIRGANEIIEEKD
jgi:tetratricopeptide (TPR) repeat protein